jgi:hypothetical protein
VHPSSCVVIAMNRSTRLRELRLAGAIFPFTFQAQ